MPDHFGLGVLVGAILGTAFGFRLSVWIALYREAAK